MRMSSFGEWRWRIAHAVVLRELSRAAHKVLSNHELTDASGNDLRWLKPDIDRFLQQVRSEARLLWTTSGAEDIPNFGNRLMLLFAVYTAASDRVLRRMRISPAAARGAFANIAWDVYRRSIQLYSLPVRLITRDPGRRLRWTIRGILKFPFSTPGAPGYAADVRVRGNDLETHFTHCPPNSYIARLAQATNDPHLYDTFRESWCRFDWPLADVIAGDGKRGHYSRPHTLSRGDTVCDMCWLAAVPGECRGSWAPSPPAGLTA
jgi:hypothetical protein